MKLNEIMVQAKKLLKSNDFDENDFIRYITDVDLYVTLNIIGNNEFKGYTDKWYE